MSSIEKRKRKKRNPNAPHRAPPMPRTAATSKQHKAAQSGRPTTCNKQEHEEECSSVSHGPWRPFLFLLSLILKPKLTPAKLLQRPTRPRRQRISQLAEGATAHAPSAQDGKIPCKISNTKVSVYLRGMSYYQTPVDTHTHTPAPATTQQTRQQTTEQRPDPTTTHKPPSTKNTRSAPAERHALPPCANACSCCAAKERLSCHRFPFSLSLELRGHLHRCVPLRRDPSAEYSDSHSESAAFRE